MAAIIRVKRRRKEDPAESIVISCKRRREDGEDPVLPREDSGEVKGIFKFSGTVTTLVRLTARINVGLGFISENLMLKTHLSLA